MTEPVEEAEVEETEEEEEEGHNFPPAPLDDPDKDVYYTGKTLTEGDIDDIQTGPSEPVEEEEEEEKEPEESDEFEEPEPEPEPVAEEPEEPDGDEIDPDSHIVKVNGEEYSLSTDDLIAGYQQAAASQQKFQRASEVERAARTVIDNVLDPDKSVETIIDLYSDQLGGDRDKAAEKVDDIIGKRIQHLIDLEEMSDDERELHTMKEDKERMQAQLAEQQAADYNRQQQEQINYQNTQAVPLLDRAILKYNLDAGSAEDTEASQILAEYVRQGYGITQDLADTTVADVLSRRQELLHSTLSGMTAADLASANPDLAKQVQQRSVEEIKASRATTEKSPKGSTSRRRKAKTDTEFADSNDFFNSTDF